MVKSKKLLNSHMWYYLKYNIKKIKKNITELAKIIWNGQGQLFLFCFVLHIIPTRIMLPTQFY